MELAHLAERVEPNAPRPRLEGDYVVYWMRLAVRATENAALDVALQMGEVLKKPVFVYHALSERYRFASDRHHTFILEGARDAQRQLKDRGIGAAFHLERPGDREPRLKQLAARAALVVTDFSPVQPMVAWDVELSRVAPLWRVDASCVVPQWLFPEPLLSAADFRAAAEPQWQARLEAPWLDVEPRGSPFLPELDFHPVDLEREAVPALVARCEVDHGVAPVHHTPGGTRAALERWQLFLDEKLGHYARDRHDPLREGTSRMSAYLHHGHVSALRLARDCAAHRTDGAQEYLEELLVRRELAWHFCRHQPKHDQLHALPAWARQTLTAHENDRREFLPSWEQLARAQTGEPLWDAAQRSLLIHGELHHSVRIGWAKALLGWTRTAPEALAVLLDLNHRYALDGRDPSSYAGVLWCLGAMDGPCEPEQPVLGSVRPRPLSEIAQRFDAGEYARLTRRPSAGHPLTVAVIGAGVAGAACARALLDAGQVVTVLEELEGVGGRVSSWRDQEHSFDDGEQFFTVRDERFAKWVRAWNQERLVKEWKPRLGAFGEVGAVGEETRLVALPAMDSLVKRLLADVEVRTASRVAGLSRRNEHWTLLDPRGASLGEFEVVVVATGPSRAAQLVDGPSYTLSSRLKEAKVAPCWTVLAAFAAPLELELDAAHVSVGPLSWVARDSSKPERPPGERWVLQATAEWSQRHQDESRQAVVPQLLEAFFATTGVKPVEPVFVTAHCALEARVLEPLGEPCLFDAALRLGVCGAAFLGSSVESAFLSGTAVAGRINALLPDRAEEPSGSRRRASQLRLF